MCNNVMYPEGIEAVKKIEPLPKEKLYEMAGKPVYVVGLATEIGWKVIRKIYISQDRIEIAFTDNDISSYNLDMLKCYDREVPDVELPSTFDTDDPEVRELIRHFANRKRL